MPNPLTFGLLVALAGVACAPKTSSKPQSDARAPPRTVAPATAGFISGAVRLNGTPPAGQSFPIAEPACKNPGGRTISDVLVSDGKLQNAFVYIRDGLEDYKFDAPDGEVEIDQTGCSYAPLVVGVRVGQPLVFVNNDRTLHNVHTLPEENDGTNFAMPMLGQRSSLKFGASEVMIKTKCDVHPWMRAWVGVVAHPHFAVTGPDGAFAFQGVPPGDYVIEAWHERFGRVSQSVHLGEKGRETLDLAMTP